MDAKHAISLELLYIAVPLHYTLNPWQGQYNRRLAVKLVRNPHIYTNDLDHLGLQLEVCI